MGEAARIRPVFSVDDYLEYEVASPEKHEFVDGEILAIAGGSALHYRIVARITTALNVLLDNSLCEAVSADQRVRAGQQNDYFYPDVTVYCGDAEFESRRAETLLTPLVLFEVLSPSTSQYDRTTKLQAYKSIRSLTDYVIIWQDMVRVELLPPSRNNSLQGTGNRVTGRADISKFGRSRERIKLRLSGKLIEIECHADRTF